MKMILKMNYNQPKGKSYDVTHFSLNNTNDDKKNRQTTATAAASSLLTTKPQPLPPSLKATTSNKPNNIRSVIERGASWSHNETTILLSLWGQDMVQRQLTNSKRTRHVWETIANKIQEFGYNRTPDQVRTRVFNMIAEYRRILKNPTNEKINKCAFFYSLHRVYQAKDLNGVRAALSTQNTNACNEDDYRFSADQIDFDQSHHHDQNENNSTDPSSELDDKEDDDEEEEEEIFTYALSPYGLNNNASLNTSCNSNSNSFLNQNQKFKLNNQMMMMMLQQQQQNNNNNNNNNSQTNSLNGIDSDRDHSQDSWLKRKGDSDLNNNQNYHHTSRHQSMKKCKKSIIMEDCCYDDEQQQQLNFDELVFNLTNHDLIDKMFDYLAKCNESMLEWVKLEQIRLQQDLECRKKEHEDRDKRDKQFIDALMAVKNEFLNHIKSNDDVGDVNVINREQETIECKVVQEQEQTMVNNDGGDECFDNYDFTSVLHEETVESFS